MSKRGAGISLNFIILAILALITLIVIALFFTGGIAKLFETEKDITELTLTPQMENLAKSQCELYCANENKNSYEDPSFSEALMQKYDDCDDLLGKPFSDCVDTKTCQPEVASSDIECNMLTAKSSCEDKPGCAWK